MALELGARGERNSAEHVHNALRFDLPAVVTVQDISREIHILALACRAIEFDQRHFNFRMSGNDGLLICAGAKICQHEIFHHAGACIHERGVTGPPIVGDCTLDHVAETVHFVPDFLIVLSHPQRRAVALVVGVQISIRLLDGDDFMDHRICDPAQLRHSIGLQRPANCIDPLVNVRVREIRPNLLRRALANQAAEIIHAPVRLQLIAHSGNAPFAVGLPALGPEALLNCDRVDRHTVQLCVWGIRYVDDPLVLPGHQSTCSTAQIKRTSNPRSVAKCE